MSLHVSRLYRSNGKNVTITGDQSDVDAIINFLITFSNVLPGILNVPPHVILEHLKTAHFPQPSSSIKVSPYVCVEPRAGDAMITFSGKKYLGSGILLQFGTDDSAVFCLFKSKSHELFEDLGGHLSVKYCGQKYCKEPKCILSSNAMGEAIEESALMLEFDMTKPHAGDHWFCVDIESHETGSFYRSHVMVVDRLMGSMVGGHNNNSTSQRGKKKNGSPQRNQRHRQQHRQQHQHHQQQHHHNKAKTNGCP